MSRTRILIVDEQHLFRRSIAQALRSVKNIEVVGDICPLSLLYKLEAKEKIDADILLYGNNSSGVLSLMVPWVVQKQQPGLGIIVMAPSIDHNDLLNALVLRISAYVRRDIPQAELLQIVSSVSHGEYSLFQTLLENRDLALERLDYYRTMLCEEPYAGYVEANSVATALGLSAGELEVLRCTSKGHNLDRLAGLLGLSREEVRTRVISIFRKLGVQYRIESTGISLQQGASIKTLFEERSVRPFRAPEPVSLPHPVSVPFVVNIQAAPERPANFLGHRFDHLSGDYNVAFRKIS